MNCELCGLSDSKFYRTEIEGATLILCQTCSKYGKILGEVNEDQKSHNFKQKTSSFNSSSEKELRMDYPKLIKEAIEENKTSVEELAVKIKESQLDLKKVLTGKLIPSDSLAEKIEKALKVSLFEKFNTFFKSKNEDKEQSFEDVVEIKRKQG